MTPLTYPARPINGGPLPQALKYAKPGEWRYEPKYNGWRALVHVPSGTMFNRKGEQLSIASEFKVALIELRMRDVAEWLDVEALERRHGIGRGSLIVLDVPVPMLTYAQRRVLLKNLPAVSLEELIDEGKIYHAPDVDCLPLEAWEKLQATNQRLGCEFYEGLVAKRVDSTYPIQLRSPDEEFRGWCKHRWAF